MNKFLYWLHFHFKWNNIQNIYKTLHRKLSRVQFMGKVNENWMRILNLFRTILMVWKWKQSHLIPNIGVKLYKVKSLGMEQLGIEEHLHCEYVIHLEEEENLILHLHRIVSRIKYPSFQPIYIPLFSIVLCVFRQNGIEWNWRKIFTRTSTHNIFF